jgi:phospholipase C
MDSRREFIKKAALLSGAAGLFQVLPTSIQKAFAIEPEMGSTWKDAEHVVILMQENRSFDHCFGTLRGVRGFNDPRAIQLPNKNLVWLQTNAAGETYAPFRLDMHDSKATWMDSLPHSWANQVEARNDGKYNRWLDVKQNSIPEYAHMPLTLGFYNREDIPFYYALADAFTVCDQNFCSALTGTNPNRLYFWSGTVREKQDGNSRAHVWNDDMDFGTLRWTTFPERLEARGITWKVYQNEVSIDVGFEGEQDAWLSNFQDNPLEFFAQYNIKLYSKHLLQLQKRSAALPGEISLLENKLHGVATSDPQFRQMSEELEKKKQELASAQKDLQEWTPERFASLSEKEKNLHRKAFTSNDLDPHAHQLSSLSYRDNGIERELLVPRGDVLHQFREDVNKGNLPVVSWLAAPENFSDHPSSAWFGAWYVSEVLDILTQNPAVWKKTIFILAYDENDGYFDHVPPFVAPHPTNASTGRTSRGIDTTVEFVTAEEQRSRNGFPEKYERECSIGLGYRVPLVIASPWSRGGWVNSQIFDHTSCLMFLENFLSLKTGTQVAEPNISTWRRAVCGDLTSVFRPYTGEKIKMPDFVAKDAFMEGIHKAKFMPLPSGYKALSDQEISRFNQDPMASSWMAIQEKGKRASCAIPYELHVHGRLSSDKKSVEVHFAAGNEIFGQASAGSPFMVYAPGKYLRAGSGAEQTFEALRTWAYAVAAGEQLTDNWPIAEFDLGIYHLRIYGPNGFYRELQGNAEDPLLEATCGYQRAAGSANTLTGNIDFTLRSLGGSASYACEIIDNAYKTNAYSLTVQSGSSSTIALQLGPSFGWYDFTLRVKGFERFEQRFAGRVETGKPGFSDPFMGREIPG